MASNVYEAIAELLRSGKKGAVITLIETVGSTPRKAGAKMLVTEDGRLVGTVGGGCVEADLVAYARQAMREGKVLVREVDLTAKSRDENDMLCGGKMKALIEPIRPEEKVIIFGGGHISRALHDILALLEFHITITDDRPQFANPERFPKAQNIIAAPFEEQFSRLNVDPTTAIIIVTRGHSYDEYCMEEALKTNAGFIALVGSRTKYAVFRKNLREKGFTDEQLNRVLCPAGLAIGAETPEEIAVSIAAQLVAWRRTGQPACASETRKPAATS